MMEHLSRVAIERSLARDHSQLDSDAEHLRACRECRDRKGAILAERAAYLQRFPATEFARGVLAKATGREPARRRGWRARAIPAWTAAAALAAGLVAVWQRQALVPEPRALDPRPDEPSHMSAPNGAGEIRTKGTASRLDAYVRREGVTQPLRNGETLAKGDPLAFTVTLTEPRYLLLLGVDTGGGVTRYYPPPDVPPAGPLPAGRAQLDVGVELDDSRGDERVIALFSRAPLDEAAVRRRIAAVWAQARSAPGAPPRPLPLELGAEQTEVWFRK